MMQDKAKDRWLGMTEAHTAVIGKGEFRMASVMSEIFRNIEDKGRKSYNRTL
jgi:hypothetical protein